MIAHRTKFWPLQVQEHPSLVGRLSFSDIFDKGTQWALIPLKILSCVVRRGLAARHSQPPPLARRSPAHIIYSNSLICKMLWGRSAAYARPSGVFEFAPP